MLVYKLDWTETRNVVCYCVQITRHAMNFTKSDCRRIMSDRVPPQMCLHYPVSMQYQATLGPSAQKHLNILLNFEQTIHRFRGTCIVFCLPITFQKALACHRKCSINYWWLASERQQDSRSHSSTHITVHNHIGFYLRSPDSICAICACLWLYRWDLDPKVRGGR